MLKRVTLVKRMPGLSDEDLDRYWRIEHAELVLKVPGVCGYVQNHRVFDLEQDTNFREFDGFAEIWFEDELAMKRAMETEEWRAVVVHGKIFLAEFTGYFVREYVLRSPTPTFSR
ncbi:MAG: EthD family reductase [Devosia sp.]|nr:EthD family reductase [Devosia sp.]